MHGSQLLEDALRQSRAPKLTLTSNLGGKTTMTGKPHLHYAGYDAVLQQEPSGDHSRCMALPVQLQEL